MGFICGTRCHIMVCTNKTTDVEIRGVWCPLRRVDIFYVYIINVR
jgi:hypothetical protein